MKVARYEVPGNGAKRQVRPGRTIETLGFWSRTPLSDCQHWSIVPFLLRPAVASLWRGLRARSSSKSEGGILTTADRPGRIAV
jgi:hypothetical protein